ncbi:FAD/NAD(P)-binding protein [Streptomyces sp. L7]
MEPQHSTMQHSTMQDGLGQDRGTSDMAKHASGMRHGPMNGTAAGTRRVTVVGAGFSGTLTAIRLLHFADTPLEICLIEREEGYRYGGIAFGQASTNWEHMLNIQAGRITLRRERPEDFLEWANEEADRSEWPKQWQYHTFGVACVVPRRMFRQYLAERLRSAAADAHTDVTLRELTGEVIDVRGEGGGYVVKYADAGDQGGVHDLPSDQVILATGHLAPVQAPFYHRIKRLRPFHRRPLRPWRPGAVPGDRRRGDRPRHGLRAVGLRHGDLPRPHRPPGADPDLLARRPPARHLSRRPRARHLAGPPPAPSSTPRSSPPRRSWRGSRRSTRTCATSTAWSRAARWTRSSPSVS